MIRIEPYRKGDALLVKARREYGDDDTIAARIDGSIGVDGVYMHTFINRDNSKVAIMGGTVIWPGVFEVWSIISEEGLRNPLSLFRNTKHLVDTYEKMLKLFRMQMTVREDFYVAQDWALALGFKPEGKLEKFGPDRSNYYMFARVN